MGKKIHDKGYKRVLTKKKHFIHMMRKYIDASLGERILEEDLELVDKEFIPKDFKEREADIIYKAKLRDKEVIFYVLLELQSSVDYTMPFRLLMYMTELEKRIFGLEDIHTRSQKGFKLPPIVPIILYNGISNWNVARSFSEYTEAAWISDTYTIDFKYFFLDLKEKAKELLTSTNTLIDNIFILDQARSTEELKMGIEVVVRRLKALNEDEQIDLVDWVRDVLMKKAKDKKLVEEACEIMKKGDALNMTYAIERIFDEENTKFLKKGIEQGIEEGIEQGVEQEKIRIIHNMLMLNIPVDQIAKVVELSVKEIEEMRKKATKH